MKPLPTDLDILNAIYDRYYNDFAFNAAKRDQKAIVPIDIRLLAQDLGVDADIVFGRLYYHLDRKYRYSVSQDINDPTRRVKMFLGRTELGYDAVHFSYLSSVLAGLRAEERQQQTNTNIAWYSLAVSCVAVLASIVSIALQD